VGEIPAEIQPILVRLALPETDGHQHPAFRVICSGSQLTELATVLLFMQPLQ
jgi:hypothetical protein